MANPVQLVSDQKLAIGWTILDAGGEPYTEVPPGYLIGFSSTDPAIVGVVVRPDGLNADLTTDGIGLARIDASVQKPDGTHLPGSPDSLEVTVVLGEPGSAVFTVGAPEPE